jgi:hypothetical protein
VVLGKPCFLDLRFGNEFLWTFFLCYFSQFSVTALISLVFGSFGTRGGVRLPKSRPSERISSVVFDEARESERDAMIMECAALAAELHACLGNSVKVQAVELPSSTMSPTIEKVVLLLLIDQSSNTWWLTIGRPRHCCQ